MSDNVLGMLNGKEVHKVPSVCIKIDEQKLNNVADDNPTKDLSPKGAPELKDNIAVEPHPNETVAEKPQADVAFAVKSKSEDNSVAAPKPDENIAAAPKTKDDVKSKSQEPPKPQVATPDTTVLGMDEFFDDEIELSNDPVIKDVDTSSSQDDDKENNSKNAAKQDESPQILNDDDDDIAALDDRTSKDKSSLDTKAKNNKAKSEKAKSKSKMKIQTAAKRKTSAKSKFMLVRISTDEKIIPEGDKFSVGKSKFTDFQIRGNNTVSRTHVILSVKTTGSIHIQDAESKNGTSIDGVYLKPNSPKLLKAGQTVRMSDEEFLVKKI